VYASGTGLYLREWYGCQCAFAECMLQAVMDNRASILNPDKNVFFTGKFMPYTT
jgi:hypothetical protein